MASWEILYNEREFNGKIKLDEVFLASHAWVPEGTRKEAEDAPVFCSKNKHVDLSEAWHQLGYSTSYSKQSCQQVLSTGPNHPNLWICLKNMLFMHMYIKYRHWFLGRKNRENNTWVRLPRYLLRPPANARAAEVAYSCRPVDSQLAGSGHGCKITRNIISLYMFYVCLNKYIYIYTLLNIH